MTQNEGKINLLLAQFHPKKGDYAHNVRRVGDIFEQIASEGLKVDVVTLPETGLTGYFLEGGVRESARRQGQVFKDLQAEYLKRCGPNAPLLDITFGYYEEYNGAFYNAALYLTLGAEEKAENSWKPGIIHNHRKFFLPTYGVFDEERFVSRGRKVAAFDTRFGKAGVLICEDVWHSITSTILALQGAQIIYVGNASPARTFATDEPGNLTRWRELVKSVSDEHNLYMVLTNLVGFEGGKGFIGGSVVTNPFGEVVLNGPVADECLLQVQIDLADMVVARAENPLLADLQNGLPDLVAELNAIERH